MKILDYSFLLFQFFFDYSLSVKLASNKIQLRYKRRAIYFTFVSVISFNIGENRMNIFVQLKAGYS